MHFRNCHSYQGREANSETKKKKSIFLLENEHFWPGALQKGPGEPNDPLKGPFGPPNSHLFDPKSYGAIASLSFKIRSISIIASLLPTTYLPGLHLTISLPTTCYPLRTTC